MASIFKRSRDRNRRRSCWYISYDDETGKRRTKKGFTDKRATEDLALEIESEVRRKKHGLLDPGDALRKAASKSPIEEHLLAFETSISKNTSKHVKLTMTRVRRLAVEVEMKTLRDIDIESIEAVLGDMLEADEIGHRTYNHYVQAMHQFCTWLVPKRLPANPIVGMARLNPDVDVRHPRRALTSDEFEQLVNSARTSGVHIQCYTGEERARIYILSYMTGLRRKELASLTPASFKLTDSPSTLTVEAACSKHRRKDVLPLHPELVAMLKLWLRGMARNERLFPKLGKRRTWLMVKKDLERVGIPYKTEEGFADFHAAGRHTHITELLRSGASLPEARELARHSDIRMTMKYTHIGIHDQARAVSQLPWRSTRNDENDEQSDNPDDEDWQRHDSGTRRPNGHSVSSIDNEVTPDNENHQSASRDGNAAYGSSSHAAASSGTQPASMRHAGSIPAASIKSACTQ